MVLGLDLQGTRLGWAVLVRDEGPVELVDAGVVMLGIRQEPGTRKGTTRQVEIVALRALDVRAQVRYRIDLHAPEVVAYEHVIGHGPGARNAHSWGAVQQAVLEACHGMPVQLRAVGVSSGKLALGGSGRATPEEMEAEAIRRWGQLTRGWMQRDGDALDAAGVALAVLEPREAKAAKAKRQAAERRAAKGAA